VIAKRRDAGTPARERTTGRTVRRGNGGLELQRATLIGPSFLGGIAAERIRLGRERSEAVTRFERRPGALMGAVMILERRRGKVVVQLMFRHM
jgi:hypothetical protein